MEPKMQLLDTKWIESNLSDSKNCVVGVSGGVDSMVLLHWLSEIRSQIPIPFKIVHINHGIHPDSDQWAELVGHTCINLDLPYSIERVSITEHGKNIEYAARKARYKAFCSPGVDTVILAHHLNDQIETFFLKLLRGSGVRGLKSMPVSTPCWYDENVKLVRPLLNVSRSTIETYAAMNNIAYTKDPSNSNNKFDRNYIRNIIWPSIIERFDIADINIAKSIELLGEAWELTTVLAEKDYNECLDSHNTLDWERVRNLGSIRIKNLILYILSVNNVYGYSVGHIQQFAYGLMNANLDSKNELSTSGFKMRKVGKRIFIELTAS